MAKEQTIQKRRLFVGLGCTPTNSIATALKMTVLHCAAAGKKSDH
jgi:hypothetical protein